MTRFHMYKIKGSTAGYSVSQTDTGFSFYVLCDWPNSSSISDFRFQHLHFTCPSNQMLKIKVEYFKVPLSYFMSNCGLKMQWLGSFHRHCLFKLTVEKNVNHVDLGILLFNR